MGIHTFYHVDRSQQLQEGQVLELDSNKLSKFGNVYWHVIKNKPVHELSDAERREMLLEEIRRTHLNRDFYESRMRCFFGANSIEDAKRFHHQVGDKPPHAVPIYEVTASRFWSLDMNWLDFVVDDRMQRENMRRYWYGEITNHNPENATRQPPLLEVMMSLPVTIGKIVAWVGGS
jgi:hypothetical protein